VRNAGTDVPMDHVRIEENLCYFGPTSGFPVQVQAAAGSAGPVEFIGNWLGAKVSGSGARAYWHPSSAGSVAIWSGNRDTETGAVIVGPA
jgi:hypothetical protein